MSQTHTWFATGEDLKLVLAWLRDAQAEIVGTSPFPCDVPCDGRELVLHFPSIGPLEFWPNEIKPSDYPENSARWRQAVILRARNEPHRRQVDADRSAAAGLRLPEFRDDAFWVSGCLWFPGSRLRETFPELARLCARFQRWIRRYDTVFDNTKDEDKSAYSYQLCMSGVMQYVVALPTAQSLLQSGAFMVDHGTSPKCYKEFKRRLELSGHYNRPQV